MFVDKVRNNLGVGVVLKLPKEVIFKHCLRLNFPTTNNETKYEPFIVGLQSTIKLKVPELLIFNYIKLIVNQVIGKFKGRGAKMMKYLAVANNLLTEFKVVRIKQVGKDLNLHAYALIGLASVFEGEIG